MNNKSEKRIVWLLLICAVFMTVGFASYSKQLTYTGNVEVKASNWDISLDTNSYKESSGSVAATSKTVDATAWSFAATLSKPGDFYEATVTVKNAGTLKAKLTTLTMNSLTSDQAEYLTYTVTYDDETPWVGTTSGLNLELPADSTAPLKVRVEYVKPDSASKLPSTATTVTLTGSLDYVLAE